MNAAQAKANAQFDEAVAKAVTKAVEKAWAVKAKAYAKAGIQMPIGPPPHAVMAAVAAVNAKAPQARNVRNEVRILSKAPPPVPQTVQETIRVQDMVQNHATVCYKAAQQATRGIKRLRDAQPQIHADAPQAARVLVEAADDFDGQIDVVLGNLIDNL